MSNKIVSVDDYKGTALGNCYIQKSKKEEITPDTMLNQLNESFSKGLIDGDLYNKAVVQLDSLVEKAGIKKYFKREGVPGKYKYYYTEAEYKEAKGKGGEKKTSKEEGLVEGGYEDYKVKSKELNRKVDKLSDKLNSFPRTNSGSVSDDIRGTKEYKEAKGNYDLAFKELRTFGSNSPKKYQQMESQERRFKSTDEVKKSLEENIDILKSENVAYTFNSSNTTFKKKGKDLKQKAIIKKSVLEDRYEKAKKDASSLKGVLEVHGIKFKEREDGYYSPIYSYDDEKIKNASSIAGKTIYDCIREYSSLMYRCERLNEEIEALKILEDNFEDNKSYEVTMRQLQSLEKSEESDIEKGLDPKGRWITVDGRHIHLNSGGKVDAGKVYGKDNKDSKDETSGKGSKNTKPKGNVVSDKDKLEAVLSNKDKPFVMQKKNGKYHVVSKHVEGGSGDSRTTFGVYDTKQEYVNKMYDMLHGGSKEKETPVKSSSKTGIKEVDEALSSHGASSETPAISRNVLSKLKDKLEKKVDKLSSGTAASGSNKQELNKHSKALGEVKKQLASHEGKVSEGKDSKSSGGDAEIKKIKARIKKIESLEGSRKRTDEKYALQDKLKALEKQKNSPIKKSFEDNINILKSE